MSKNVMQGVLGLLAVGCVLALVGPAGADFTVKNSADFDWKYEMDNDLKPSETDLDGNSVMDFTELGTGGSSSVLDRILTMNTGVSGSFYYDNLDSNQTWDLDPNITYANGYTYEVRLQITGGTTPRGFVFLAAPDDNGSGAWLDISHDGQTWGQHPDNYPLVELGEADNTDAFHVFRVAQTPGAAVYSVWRDGVLLSDTLEAGYTEAKSKIAFGDVGYTWGGDVDVDYFRFISGAWAPDYTPPPDPIPGDANNDKIVNDADASILAAHWQQSGEGIGWDDGDFNDDGVVNDEDASILAAHWLQSQQEGSTAPVPEPSVLVLLLGVGLIGLLARARRRR